MPMYTKSPFQSSSTAGSRTGVLIREARRRVVPRPARGHATTASGTQGAPPSTSRREPEPHSHNDDDLDNGDENPYPDFHVDPPSVERTCLPAMARRANESLVVGKRSEPWSEARPRRLTSLTVNRSFGVRAP